MNGFGTTHEQLALDDDRPDQQAIELAAMCDLVVSGVARVVSATFPRTVDDVDTVTLARQITAGRGLNATFELAPHSLTVHITRRNPQIEAARG